MYEYSTTRRQYIDANGQAVSYRELRRRFGKLSDYVAREAKRLGERFANKDIDIEEFERAMRLLLKSGHIISATIGRGGRKRMTQRDWGKVGAKIQWQYGYLSKFAQKVANGTLSAISSAYRSRQYASALYISFSSAYLEAQTEGNAEVTKAEREDELLCRLIQNSEEGCEECTADAAEDWMPISDMTPIGDRICGDFCKCFIEFEDDAANGRGPRDTPEIIMPEFFGRISVNGSN